MAMDIGPIVSSREDEPNVDKGAAASGTGTGEGGKEAESSEEGKGDKAETPEAKVARLEAEKAEALNVARNAVREAQGAKAYVASLTATLKDSAERVAARSNGDNGEEQPSMAERIQEDPESVLNEHFDRRTRPIIQANLDTQARYARELAVSRLSQQKLFDAPDAPTVWGQYGEEIEEFLNQFGADTRATPDAYDAAVRWVRSKHIDDEVSMREKSRREAEKRSFTEGATAGPTARKAGRALNDVQRAVAKGLGLSEDDYKQYMVGDE